ncbi:MAG: hypothetical protein V2A76_06090 [Planctomycetota bacterium]
MGNSRPSAVRGPQVAGWVLGLLPVCLGLLAAPCSATAGKQKKPEPQRPSAYAGRSFGQVGSGRRMSASGSGRLLPSHGSGRRMSSAGGGRLMGPLGSGMPVQGGERYPAVGWGVPVLPPQGGGAPVDGIPVWPEVTQPEWPGPDPVDPVDPAPRPVPREWQVPPDIVDGTSGPIREDPVIPHPMADLADQLARTARTQLRQGSVSQAESSLNSAVTLFPSDPVLRIEYALALSGVGNFHGAVRQLVDGFRLHPDLVVEPLNVVAAYGGEELFAVRMEEIDRYREAFPLDSNSRFLRAFLLLHSGALEEAQRDFLALKESDPEFPFVGAFCRRMDGLVLAESLAAPVEEQGERPPEESGAAGAKEPER